MAETLLLSTLIIVIAMALLCVKVFLKKDGRFGSMHISDSQAMRQRGIDCVIGQDKAARRNKAKVKG
ncbi:MAG: hypothetical protein LUC49_07870 [Prevotella sp.]|nr:hypothetical protein [Prevotella sp.]